MKCKVVFSFVACCLFTTASFSQERTFHRLIAALADDGVAGNAIQARHSLKGWLHTGDDVRAALEEALTPADRQQRQHAFVLLVEYYLHIKPGSDPSGWSEPFYAAMVEALADDEIPNNADSAKEVFLWMLQHADENVRQKGALLVESELSSPDYSVRQRSTEILLENNRSWNSYQRTLHSKVFENLIEGLNDSLPFLSERHRYQWLTACLHSTEQPYYRQIVPMLEKALESPSPNMKHFCAVLLMEHYKNQSVPQEEWNQSAIDYTIEAIGDDGVRGDLFHAAKALFDLQGSRVQENLHKALDRRVSLEHLNAAYMLCWMVKPGVHPKISDALLQHLKADKYRSNADYAFFGLRQLGKANLEDLIKRMLEPDWQQAAYLRFLACIFEVDWQPPEDIYAGWFLRALQKEDDGFGSGTASRIIATAAVYLTPSSYAQVEESDYPYHLKKILLTKPELETPQQKINWLKDWVWLDFLKEFEPPVAGERYGMLVTAWTMEYKWRH